MSGKTKLLLGLLALGIVLVGGGLWLSQQSFGDKMEFPEGDPVIYQQLDYVMQGKFSRLFIYADGAVVYVEDSGLRMIPPGQSAIRRWSTGQLAPAELDALLNLFRDGRFFRLDEYIQFPGETDSGGVTREGDGKFTFRVNSAGLNKTVTVYGYLTPDNGQTYPDMPVPLNDIYVHLRALVPSLTQVAEENIS
jgi:hypothetical protein